MDWDDDLQEDLRLKWITWCNEIRPLKEIVIPRNCSQDCGKGLAEIHILLCIAQDSQCCIELEEMPRGGSNLANRIADVQETSNPNDGLSADAQ
ncbi:hypothetical protein HNY73_013988 [Argiope bruennichi]|uniref:Uncharacterized protein n=1 Tax=Argiope bruennichi TaxID=94029 RepID=A0A8T0EME8_ARGBR|nr:hypothetical protein HNY73_013988 [Argiope bruennichi]